MAGRRVAVALGVAATTFVVAGVAATELASAAIEFSVLVGIPVGLLAAAVSAVVVYGRLRPGLGRGWQATATGFATVGYTLVALLAVRYAVAAVRPWLGLEVVVVGSLLAGVVAAAVTRLRPGSV